MEARQQAGEVLIFTDIQSIITRYISDGPTIAFNSTGLQFSRGAHKGGP